MTTLTAMEQVRQMDAVLEVSGVDRGAYLAGLENRLPRRGEDFAFWYTAELRGALAQCRRRCETLDINARHWDKIAGRARRRDIIRTFCKGIFANGLSFGVANLAGIVPSVVLTLAGMPVLGLVLNAALTILTNMTYGAVMQDATAAVSRRFDVARPTWVRPLAPTSARSALGTEMIAELVCRTGPRAAITWPLRSLQAAAKIGAGGLGPMASSAAGVGLGLLGVALGPLTTALGHAGGLVSRRSRLGASNAPLLGLSVSVDAGLVFDQQAFDANIARVSMPALQAGWAALRQLCRTYREHLGTDARSAAARYPHFEQINKGLFGSSVLSSTLNGLSAFGALGSATASAVVSLVSSVLGTSVGAANVLTKENVLATSPSHQRVRAAFEGRPSVDTPRRPPLRTFRQQAHSSSLTAPPPVGGNHYSTWLAQPLARHCPGAQHSRRAGPKSSTLSRSVAG